MIYVYALQEIYFEHYYSSSFLVVWGGGRIVDSKVVKRESVPEDVIHSEIIITYWIFI